MKILIVNTTCNIGSTGKIAYGLYRKLKENGDDGIVAYGRGEGVSGNKDTICIETKAGVYRHALLSRITGYTGRYSNKATKKLLKLINSERPDIVQLYNLHGYYLNIKMLFSYLKAENIPTVYSMLDEFPYMGRCCYSYECSQFETGCKACKMKRKEYPASFFLNRAKKIARDKENMYRSFERLYFAGPEWVIKRADRSWLLKDKPKFCVDEFVDTNKTFYPRDTETLKKRLGITEKQVVLLNVAPFSNERKGGRFYLELAEQFKDSKKYVFIFVGYDGDGEKIPPNMKAVGYVSNQDELAEYYTLADRFICTSVADTMPNVCLDSLACGTPVLGFDISGIPYVAEKPFGEFVAPMNMDVMKRKIEETGKKSEDLSKASREYAIGRYSPEAYFSKMYKIYENILKK